MENNTNYQSTAPVAPAAGTNPQPEGSWVPVDPSTLGFQFQGIQPNQPVKGPDGNIYCFSDSAPQLAGIQANQNCAIPTPSGIVQMPPIVQPIALVPYTSQNQPMLQYDPYSRPVEPQVQPETPNYIRRPYRGVSIAALVASLAALIVMLLLSGAEFAAITGRDAFGVNGIQAVLGILAIFGVGVESHYYSDYIALQSNVSVYAYIFPFLVAVVMVILLVLAIKYLVKFCAKRTPRCVSAGAIIALLLTIAAFGMLIGMAGLEIPNGDSYIAEFFTRETTITWGFALVVALVLEILLIIIPLIAKKNAYYIEGDQTKRTVQLKD